MADTINERIRAHIASAGAKFVAVKAVTKSGEIVSFEFNPRQLANHMAAQPALSEPHARGAETRRQNNPTLFNVMDRSRRKYEKYGRAWEAENPGQKWPGTPSSFYLDNVLIVAANGDTVEYRIPNPGYRAALPALPVGADA